MSESNLIDGNNFQKEISAVPVVKKLPHHEQFKLCETRPQYRQGRKLIAVKAYTINNESKYLIISGIPDIKIGTELSNMCLKYGKIQLLYPLPDYPSERFELTYLVKYAFVRNACKAKKIIDGKSFFGGILHVCYAPELESLEETMEKLIDRRNSVAYQNIMLGKSSKEYIPTKVDLDEKKRIVEEMYLNFYDSAKINQKGVSEPTTSMEFNLAISKFSSLPKRSSKKLKVSNESSGTSKYLSDELSVPTIPSSESRIVNEVNSNVNNIEETNPTVSIETNIKENNKFMPFKVKSLMLTQPSMDYLKKPISVPSDNRNRAK